MKYYNNKTRQAGLTLIELTVVLLILIGLAGMMVPYVSGFVAKTHQSTSGVTIAELNGAVLRYQAQFFDDPDRYDSLIQVGGAASGVAGADQYALEDITANALDSLQAIGIDNVTDVNVADVTFGLGTTRLLAVGAGLQLRTFVNTVGATNQGIDRVQEVLGIPSTDNQAYVAFGIGQQSEMTSRTISEAPVHFHEGNANMQVAYSRFIAVYGIPSADNTLSGATGEDARFLGVVGPMDPVEAASGHIAEYRSDSFGS